jgi:hypothetical protein
VALQGLGVSIVARLSNAAAVADWLVLAASEWVESGGLWVIFLLTRCCAQCTQQLMQLTLTLDIRIRQVRTLCEEILHVNHRPFSQSLFCTAHRSVLDAALGCLLLALRHSQA